MTQRRPTKTPRPSMIIAFWAAVRTISLLIDDRRGAIAANFALGIVPLLTVVGVGVDYAHMTKVQNNLQNALDAAVLAAAPYSGTNRVTVGTAYLTAQIPRDLALTSSTFSTNSDGSITGTASGKVAMAILGLVNIKTVTVSATSKAGYQSGGSVCLLIKDPTASSALLMNSGVTINAPSCEIDVASSGNPAAMLNAPTLNVSSVCVAGSNVTQNGGTSSKVKPSCTTATDPFSGALPTISTSSCTVSSQNYSGYTTLYPGTYCGNFNFNGSGTLSLSSGLYVFQNTHWNLNSGWTIQGTGVTIYFADSNSYIQVNSGVAMTLSAPTSGTYANVLIYEPPGLSTSSFSVNGSAGHSLTGLVYLPSRNVTFNAMSNTTSDSLTMVLNQLILNTSSWTIAAGAKTISSASGSSSGTAYLQQ